MDPQSPRKIPETALYDLAVGMFVRGHDLRSLNANELLRSSNPMERLAGIYLTCQSGDLSYLAQLQPLMEENDAFLVWQASANLAGLAGNLNIVQLCFRGLGTAGDHHIQYFGGIALGLTCDLRAVDYLLRLHNIAEDDDARMQIERELSYLLEPEDGLIMMGAAEEIDDGSAAPPTRVNRERYFALVENAAKAIKAKIGAQSLPIFEGVVLDVVKLAKQMYDHFHEERPRIGRLYRERQVFEAATGIDCTAFFDRNLRLYPLEASATIEAFLESDADRYASGRRYFFGRAIAM